MFRPKAEDELQIGRPQRADERRGHHVDGGNVHRTWFVESQRTSEISAPEGNSIVWASNRDGVSNLYQKAANLEGEEKLLWESDQPKFPTDWSQDGRFIIYRQIDPKTKLDVWALPINGNSKEKPFPVAHTGDNETAGALSPNGRWMAYSSDESGKFEVYVKSFPGSGGKRQVSNGGGNYPRWRQDGKELFYYARDGKLMAAQVRSVESFDVVSVSSLFDFRAGSLTLTFAPYAVTGDGQRFLINRVEETEPNAPLTIVTNWTAGAKK